MNVVWASIVVIGAATVAISWSQYLIKFLSKYGLHIPAQLVMSPFETAKLADGSTVTGSKVVPQHELPYCNPFYWF